MLGDAWEWCRDVFEDDYYHRAPGINPTGPDGDFIKNRPGPKEVVLR
jgi:formylglycine-generating enzyme required for sulfatase activity